MGTENWTATRSLQYIAENWPTTNLGASTAPGVTNDVDEGYVPGSIWVDTTNDRAYLCLDNSDGAAVWTEFGNISSDITLKGTYDASTNTPDLDTSPSATIEKGDHYIVTTDGTFFTEEVNPGDHLVALQDAPTALAHWARFNGNIDYDAAGNLTIPGRVIIDDTTQATTTTDGSLQTDGGLSVAKAAVIGGDLTVDRVGDAASGIASVDADAGQVSVLNYKGGGTTYWQTGRNATNHNYIIQHYNGGWTTPLTIAHADDSITTTGDLTVGGDIELGSGGPTITQGTGAPGGTAVEGSLYLRTDGGPNAMLYMNMNGSTTWRRVGVIYSDTSNTISYHTTNGLSGTAGFEFDGTTFTTPNVELTSGGPTISTGTGAPAGTDPSSSLYLEQGTGGGAHLYVKSDDSPGTTWKSVMEANATITNNRIPHGDASGYLDRTTGFEFDGSTFTNTGNTALGTNSSSTLGFYGATPVDQAAALTTALTTVTHDAPGVADYAYSGSVTNSSAYGLSSADEFNTLLSVVANLQARVNELEAALDSTTGVGLIA